MRCLFILVITIVLSDSQLPITPPNATIINKERLWWINGNNGKPCPPGSKSSNTPTTLESKSSYLEKCVVTKYDLMERSSSGITSATKDCPIGSRWSKSRNICVKKVMGFTIPVGNSEIVMRCAPGRRYSKSTKRCVLIGKSGKKKNDKGKCLTCGIPPHRPPRPPSPRFPPGIIGRKK